MSGISSALRGVIGGASLDFTNAAGGSFGSEMNPRDSVMAANNTTNLNNVTMNNGANAASAGVTNVTVASKMVKLGGGDLGLAIDAYTYPSNSGQARTNYDSLTSRGISMGLEKLQSVFNNIEDNVQSLEDGIPVESISNSLFDDFHSFGTQGNRSELVSITKINKRQDPSPLMAINGIFVEDSEGNLSQTLINPVNGHNFKQIRINDNAGTNLLKTVNNEHGFGTVVESTYDVNTTDLGKGDFVFGSLFAHNHAKPVDRPTFIGSPSSIKSDLIEVNANLVSSISV